MSDYFHPPALAWTRRLNEPEPESTTHTFSRPAFLDALQLLPLAYRMGQYVSNERKNHREPIFDLSGMTLEPPNPGPYGGVPCGGIGGGSIMRGFRGDFRRWSLWPGRYIHRVVYADQFSLRVKRLGSNTVFATVLSAVSPNQELDHHSCCRFWNWKMDPGCATYHAVFPRAWTVYENPVPGVRVIIRQVSPFLPNNYSDSSLPTCLFHVEVINTGLDDIEASVMFTFQNGDGGEGDAVGNFIHCPYSVPVDPPSTEPIFGILMSHHRETSKDRAYDQGSFSIATQTSGIVSYCKQFISEKPKSSTSTSSHTTHGDMSSSSEDSRSQATETTNQSVFSSFFNNIRTVIDQNMFGNESDVYTGNEEADILWACFRDTGHAPTFFSHFSDDLMDPNSLDEEDSNSGSGHSRSRSFGSNRLRNNYNDEDEDDREDGEDEDDEDPSAPSEPSIKGYKVASALCVSFGVLRPGVSSQTTFSLAWDHPIVSFGSKEATTLSIPRYYSRFFGTTGLQAFHIATYALLHSEIWEEAIISWQDKVITKLENSPSYAGLDGAGDYYQYHLFNELYFLVDGGTIWSNSCNGQANPIDDVFKSFIQSWSYDEKSAVTAASNPNFNRDGTSTPPIQMYDVYKRDPTDLSELFAGRKNLIPRISSTGSEDSADNKSNLGIEVDLGVECPADEEKIFLSLQSISMTLLSCLSIYMQQHNQVIQYSNGRQDQVGQFLYYEGHEYLMYNTYDVHFYSSFALLQLFPQLELSIQRDFAAAVLLEDKTERVMIGEGHRAPRKVKSVVPHDLGSPSGTPWKETNSYNFQDVSNWKDLGPKFILQIYRDYKYIANRLYAEEISASNSRNGTPDGSGNNSPNLSNKKNSNNNSDDKKNGQKNINNQQYSPNGLVKNRNQDKDYYNYENYDNDNNNDNDMDDEKNGQNGRDSQNGVYRPSLDSDDGISGLKQSGLGNKTSAEAAVKSAALDFLKEMYPICEMIMTYTMKFDINHDGMIENSGFPDQTYDIWIATDVHAYCGGLWVAACMAMSEIIELIVEYNKHLIVGDDYDYYHILASKASYVYITKLWNGRYFNYDSSSSDHHDSIMADMLAGQWYAHACGLTALVVSSDMAYSCLETIYENNVIKFGQGRLLGAVNGMRPPSQKSISDNNSNSNSNTANGTNNRTSITNVNSTSNTSTTNSIWSIFQPAIIPSDENNQNGGKSGKHTNDVDNSCLQSKEVWTGTTYALSALMLHEANYLHKELKKQVAHHSIDRRKQVDMRIKIDKLRRMAYSTARGIHDAGWNDFGYWFATPEAWEKNGNYRSLGYMRPLAIWAMQLANDMDD